MVQGLVQYTVTQDNVKVMSNTFIVNVHITEVLIQSADHIYILSQIVYLLYIYI